MLSRPEALLLAPSDPTSLLLPLRDVPLPLTLPHISTPLNYNFIHQGTQHSFFLMTNSL